nr:hypothetical protein [Pedobacter kyonggii]
MTTAIDRSEIINTSVSNFLTAMEAKVGETKTLHELGVNNELASHIHDFFTDPLKVLLDSNASAIAGIKKLIQRLVDKLLSSQKDSIIKAFSVSVDAQMVYYICLANDSTEAREPFFEFLEFYEDLGIKNSLPLHFKFVPERVLDKVDLEPMEIR